MARTRVYCCSRLFAYVTYGLRAAGRGLATSMCRATTGQCTNERLSVPLEEVVVSVPCSCGRGMHE